MRWSHLGHLSPPRASCSKVLSTWKLFRLSALINRRHKIVTTFFFSLFKGLIIPILFACSMQTRIMLLSESPFKWLFIVSPFLSFHSIRHVLGMPRLEAYILSFFPKVQTLTWGELDVISASLYSASLFVLYFDCWLLWASMVACYFLHLLLLPVISPHLDLSTICSIYIHYST